MYPYPGKPESQPNVPRNHQSLADHNTSLARTYLQPGSMPKNCQTDQPQAPPTSFKLLQAPPRHLQVSRSTMYHYSGIPECQSRSNASGNSQPNHNPNSACAYCHWPPGPRPQPTPSSNTMSWHHLGPYDWSCNFDRPRISADARRGTGRRKARDEYTEEKEDILDILRAYIFGRSCQRQAPELWEELCRHRAAREALTTRPPPPLPPSYYGGPVIKRYTFGSISPQDQYQIDHTSTVSNRNPPHQLEGVNGDSGSDRGDDKPKVKTSGSEGDVNAVPYRIDRAPQNRRVQAHSMRSYSNASRD